MEIPPSGSSAIPEADKPVTSTKASGCSMSSRIRSIKFVPPPRNLEFGFSDMSEIAPLADWAREQAKFFIVAPRIETRLEWLRKYPRTHRNGTNCHSFVL